VLIVAFLHCLYSMGLAYISQFLENVNDLDKLHL
jgi:hypothetical protein